MVEKSTFGFYVSLGKTCKSLVSIHTLWLVGNIVTICAPVHNTPTAVSYVIRLLAVSVLLR